MDFLWLILIVLVLAVGFRAFTDLFRRVAEAVIYTGGGLVIILLLLKYHAGILEWAVKVMRGVIG